MEEPGYPGAQTGDAGGRWVLSRCPVIRKSDVSRECAAVAMPCGLYHSITPSFLLGVTRMPSAHAA